MARPKTIIVPRPEPNFEILRNIEMPPRKREGQSQFPWDQIGPRSPLFVPGRTAKKFAASAYQAAKRLGVKFSVRDFEVDGEQGCGVWLVEG